MSTFIPFDGWDEHHNWCSNVVEPEDERIFWTCKLCESICITSRYYQPDINDCPVAIARKIHES